MNTKAMLTEEQQKQLTPELELFCKFSDAADGSKLDNIAIASIMVLAWASVLSNLSNQEAIDATMTYLAGEMNRVRESIKNSGVSTRH